MAGGLVAVLVVINIGLVIGSIYRALHPDPALPVGRQYFGAVFGLVMALVVLLLIVSIVRG